MAKSDALFKLIKSLSRDEKKHVVFFATKHIIGQQNNYMEVFYVMDEAENEEIYNNEKYDESVILNRIKTKAVKNNFSVYKKHLYDLILKSLRVYGSEEEVLVFIQKSLLDINILIRKNLLDQALKKIRSAKKLTEKYHYDIEHYKLCLIERRLVRRTISNIEKGIFQIETLQTEADVVLNHIINNSKSLKIYEESFLITKDLSRLPSQKLIDLVRGNLNDSITSKSRFHQLTQYYLTCSNFYFLEKDYRNALDYLKRILDLFDQNKWMVLENISTYINTLNNYLTYCILTNKSSQFEKNFKKLHSIKTKSKYQNNLIDQHRYYLTCIYFLRKENYKEAIQQFFPQLIEWINKFESKIPTSRLMTFYYSLSITYFMEGEFMNAREWNNKLINMEVKKVRKTVQAAARFFSVIINHELGYYLTIEPMVKNLRKYLKQVNRFGTAEHTIFEALVKSSIALDDKSRKLIFQDLASKIDQLEMKNKEIETIKDWFKRKGNLTY